MLLLFPSPGAGAVAVGPPIMLGVMPLTGTVPSPYCTPPLKRPSSCWVTLSLRSPLREPALDDRTGLTVLVSLGSDTTDARRGCSSAVWYSELRDEREDRCERCECFEDLLWELCLLLAVEPADECLLRWLRWERREEEPALEMLSLGATVSTS